MKINVADKTERLVFGKIIELRGNFVEKIDEEGYISYECDMFRTTNKNDTFDELHKKEMAKQAQQNLNSTDWVEVQLNRYALMYGVDSEEYKAKLESRKELLEQRMEWESIVRGTE